MIANISQGTYIDQMVNYNQNKIEKGQANLLEVKNVFNGSIETGLNLIKSIASESNRKDKYLHISLNFPAQDKALLNDTLLKQVANTYLINLGFPEDQPIMIFKHQDTKHPHIHIVTSKIKTDGKCLNDSHLKRRSVRISRAIEEQYQLFKVVEKSKSKRVGENAGLRQHLDFHVKQTLVEKQPKNIFELQRYLSLKQIGVTELNTGLVYYNLNEQGKRADKGIIASDIAPELVAKAINEKLKDTTVHKGKKNAMRKNINVLTSFYHYINIEEFKKLLHKKGILFNYKLCASDTLVGVSYTHIKSGVKFTGEQLGVKYKAKAIAEHLTLMESKPKETHITAASLLQLSPILIKKPIYEQIDWLLIMGFRLKINNGYLMVSDYTNQKGSGYIKYAKIPPNSGINIDFINNLSKKINFSNILLKDTFLINRYNLLNNKPFVSITQNTLNFKEGIKPIKSDTKGVVSTSASQNLPQEEAIADVDKKKRKKRNNKL